MISVNEKLIYERKELLCVATNPTHSTFYCETEDDYYDIENTVVEAILSDQKAARNLHQSTVYISLISAFLGTLFKKDKKGKCFLDSCDLQAGEFKKGIELYSQASRTINGCLKKNDYSFYVKNEPILHAEAEKRLKFATAIFEASMGIATDEMWDKFQTEVAKAVNNVFKDTILVEAI